MGKVNPNTISWDNDSNFETFQPIKRKSSSQEVRQDKKRDKEFKEFKKFKGKKSWLQEEI